MRLFVALDLPEPILQTLGGLITQLKAAADIQWSAVANLHITTKFIGEFPDARLDELKDVLRRMPKTGPITVSAGGYGWFPNPHSPRVFWVGVRAEKLAALAQATDAATATLEVPAETRDYHPHLTLARIKTSASVAALRQAVAALETVEFGRFEVRSQYLYLSQNSLYTKLEEFPL